MGTIRRFTL